MIAESGRCLETRLLSMRLKVKKVLDSPGLLYRVIEMVMSRLLEVEVMVTMFLARQNLYMLTKVKMKQRPARLVQAMVVEKLLTERLVMLGGNMLDC